MEGHHYSNDTNEVMTTIESSADNEVVTGYMYCGQGFQIFVKMYVPVHGIVTAVTCPIGILANIFNIVVLTMKNMSRSPTNAILSSIAVADLLYLISILIHNLIRDVIHIDVCFKYSYEMQVVFLFTMQCAVTTTRISLMVTFLSALWRYLAVTFPLRVRQWCSLKKTYAAIVFSYVFVPLTMIGYYLDYTVDAVSFVTEYSDSPTTFVGPAKSTNSCLTLYQMGFDNERLWGAHRLYRMLYVVVLPIVVLVISILLIRSLCVSYRQHSELAQNSVSLNRSSLRTTKMLIAILLLFFITEIPSGVFVMMMEMHGDGVLNHCSLFFILITEMLNILNSTLNFVAYVTMSRKIRKNFLSLTAPLALKRTVPHAKRPNLTGTTHL